jgi:hypothetical protein
LVSGANKATPVQQLLANDPGIPGSLVKAERQILVATPDVFS